VFLKKRKILPYVNENKKLNTTKSYYHTCYVVLMTKLMMVLVCGKSFVYLTLSKT
jgi:hypothetical protein